MSEPQGYLNLVLHAHLPYVRHPEFPDFLEEDWLYEAITETYVPLLDMMERLAGAGVHYRLTMSLTPPLCHMLSDDLLLGRFRKRLDNLCELADKELHRTRSLPTPFQDTAQLYHKKLNTVRGIFDAAGGRLLSRFKALQDSGFLDILTCGATHGYLPLMVHEEARRAQIQVAVEDYRRHFGRSPRGIWLPECAFAPGVDVLLKENNILYSFLDAHGVLFGRPRPRHGVFAPVSTPAGVAFFGRDMETAHQVWSAEQGYPGDPAYREFYRDVGYDLDYSYVRPYLHEDGVRRNIGIKYHRVTGRVALSDKEPYEPGRARDMAAVHAGNFLYNRERQVEYLKGIMNRPPVVSSLYDAELYGHWWFEGPDFLEVLLKKIHYDQNVVKTISPSEYLDKYPELQILDPEPSSWGDKGYHEVWLNASNDWIYPHLHMITERMIHLSNVHPGAEGVLRRALNQAARELLLAQSSDWAFLMTVGTARTYSDKRTREHIHRFLELDHQIRDKNLNEGFVSYLENQDNIFPLVNYEVYQSRPAG